MATARPGDDPAVVAGIGTLDGKAVAVVALERGHLEDRDRRHDGRPYPEGYRKARRVMDLAERLHLPLVTLIDTPGAYPGIEAEERGLASELATLAGAHEHAADADRLGGDWRRRQRRRPRPGRRRPRPDAGGAIYSVIAPEGAATILYRDRTRAPEVSSKLKLTARELKRLDIVDEIVPEPDGGTDADPDAPPRSRRGDHERSGRPSAQTHRPRRPATATTATSASARRHAKRPRRSFRFPREDAGRGTAG